MSLGVPENATQEFNITSSWVSEIFTGMGFRTMFRVKAQNLKEKPTVGDIGFILELHVES